MNSIEELFLHSLRASLKNESVNWENPLSETDWNELYRLSEMHSVIPLIYDAVYKCSAAQEAENRLIELFKIRSIKAVSAQAVKTDWFMRLYRRLREAGLSPAVVKGVVCRSLFPNPDYRISSDEDIVVPQEQFSRCCEAITEFGMKISKPEQDINLADEVTFVSSNSPLRIELHRRLFPLQSEAYGEFNRFFADSFENLIELPVQETTVSTMNHTDNLFYLICHSFKHFLHSGFGIRQVCDITLYANAYGKYADWHRILENCREIKADLFAAAVFKIGGKYLTFDSRAACYGDEWSDIEVDELPLLEDLLSGGIYGGSSLNRKHSSGITLNAVADEKKGKKSGKGIVSSLFPPLKDMQTRYEYLHSAPFLLPAAWLSRMVKYGREISENENNSASQAMKIGRDRVELFKKYGVIGRDL